MPRMCMWRPESCTDPVRITDLVPIEVSLPGTVQEGPQDDEIVVELDGLRVAHDASGDFVFDPSEKEREFDATHAFAAVWQVTSTYKRILEEIRETNRWTLGPRNLLRVLPYSAAGHPAHYDRGTKTLHFSSHTPAGGAPVRTCRHFDIVAHQVGHAILDSLRPDLAPSEGASGDEIALHECFADLAILFSRLEWEEACEPTRADQDTLLFREPLCPLANAGGGAGDSRWPEARTSQTCLSGAVMQALCSIAELPGAEPHRRVARRLSKAVVTAFLRATDHRSLVNELLSYFPAAPGYKNRFVRALRDKNII